MKNKFQYFEKILRALAEKATCDRAKVACVIVKDNYILSTGYNGAPRKCNHCTIKHIMKDKHCINTVHAEVNAIVNAAKNGIAIQDCDMICTHRPCFRCMMILINSGIKNVYYFDDYYDNYQKYFKKSRFVKFTKIKNDEM